MIHRINNAKDLKTEHQKYTNFKIFVKEKKVVITKGRTTTSSHKECKFLRPNKKKINNYKPLKNKLRSQKRSLN